MLEALHENSPSDPPSVGAVACEDAIRYRCFPASAGALSEPEHTSGLGVDHDVGDVGYALAQLILELPREPVSIG